MDHEVIQGKNIATAAAAIGTLEDLFGRPLPSAARVSKGGTTVPHIDGKTQEDEYVINSLSALVEKTIFLWGGFYSENVRYPNYTFNFLTSGGKLVWVLSGGAQMIVPIVGNHNANSGTVV